jgi:hypothetical protein
VFSWHITCEDIPETSMTLSCSRIEILKTNLNCLQWFPSNGSWRFDGEEKLLIGEKQA